MDSIFSMKRILLALLLLCASVHASAQEYYFVKKDQTGTVSYFGRTGLETCQKYYAGGSAQPWYEVKVPASHPAVLEEGQCYYTTPGSDKVNNGIFVIEKHCSSSAGDICQPPQPQCTAGERSVFSQRRGAGPIGSEVPTTAPTGPPTSDGSCEVIVDKVNSCWSVPSGNGMQDFICQFEGTKTGSRSPAGSPGDLGPPPDAAPPSDVPPMNPDSGKGCPAGTVNMGTDSAGTPICGGKGDSPKPPTQIETKQPTQTQTNPDGTTTKTDVTTRTNADGSTTTTTTRTTTNADGSTTTTTSSQTSTNPSGGAGRDTSSDDKKDDFCSKHPELMICMNSEISGGCNGADDATACKGDAIQCGILRQARQEYCKAKADEEALKASAQYALGSSILGGTDPMKQQMDDVIKGTEVDLSSQSLDQSSFAASSCFSNRSINFHGRSIAIDFSAICSSIVGLRAVVLICSLIVAYLLVSRSVLEG